MSVSANGLTGRGLDERAMIAPYRLTICADDYVHDDIQNELIHEAYSSSRIISLLHLLPPISSDPPPELDPFPPPPNLHFLLLPRSFIIAYPTSIQDPHILTS